MSWLDATPCSAVCSPAWLEQREPRLPVVLTYVVAGVTEVAGAGDGACAATSADANMHAVQATVIRQVMVAVLIEPIFAHHAAERKVLKYL